MTEMRVRPLRFREGDLVKTPRGKIGTIARIGLHTDGITIAGVEYKVGSCYWAGWQLKHAKKGKLS